MQIYEVTDPLFKEYGKIIDSVELTELLAEMKHTPVPEDVVYVASEPKLEALAVMKELTDKTYGELPIQIGYCNGHNRKLNALEYHRSSEVDVAATELVLMLGKQQDITEEFTYDTSKVKAFRVPAGTAGAEPGGVPRQAASNPEGDDPLGQDGCPGGPGGGCGA